MEFYAEKGDQEKFNEINIAFHEAIYRCTQSKYFEQLLTDINYYIHVTSKAFNSSTGSFNFSSTGHRNL